MRFSNFVLHNIVTGYDTVLSLMYGSAVIGPIPLLLKVDFCNNTFSSFSTAVQMIINFVNFKPSSILITSYEREV